MTHITRSHGLWVTYFTANA